SICEPPPFACPRPPVILPEPVSAWPRPVASWCAPGAAWPPSPDESCCEPLWANPRPPVILPDPEKAWPRPVRSRPRPERSWPTPASSLPAPATAALVPSISVFGCEVDPSPASAWSTPVIRNAAIVAIDGLPLHGLKPRPLRQLAMDVAPREIPDAIVFTDGTPAPQSLAPVPVRHAATPV